MVVITKSVDAVRCISIASLFLLLFSSPLLLSGCDRSDAPASEKVAQKPNGTKPLTLERFETQQGTFELDIAPCTAEGCAFEVRWLKANKLISSIALPIHATDQAVEGETTNFDWGADAGLYAWGAGMVGDGQVSTVARPVVLDSDTTGLLVTQRFGFDYISQLHRLVVPRDGKLFFLWEFTDGSDHTWSATVVSAQPAITFFYVSRHVELSDSDFLRVMRLGLDKDKNKLSPELKRNVAVALVFGDFASPNSAHKFLRNDVNRCFGGYLALSSDSIAAIPKGRISLARVFVQHEKAEEEKKRLLQCGVSFKILVVDLQSSLTIYRE